MTATSQNFTLYQGDDLVLQVTVKNPDGTVKDLTGASSIKWAMAKAAKGTALLSKTLGAGITNAAPLTGVFEVTIAQGDTPTIAAGAYYHEAELVDAAGKKSTVLVGTATIVQALIA
jgi:hypothetical protein